MTNCHRFCWRCYSQVGQIHCSLTGTEYRDVLPLPEIASAFELGRMHYRLNVLNAFQNWDIRRDMKSRTDRYCIADPFLDLTVPREAYNMAIRLPSTNFGNGRRERDMRP